MLGSRKAICQGYADLFTDLATHMKLDAFTVTGQARDWLTTSNNVMDKAHGHAWNAYRVVGTWHLADATWGAGGLSFGSEEFEQKFKPFWFDVSPAKAIFYHLPTDNAWQLLPTPITPTAFQNWPYVEYDWFQLVSGESMRKALANSIGQRGDFPEIQPNAHHVQLVQAPRYGELVAGKPVKFVFSLPAGIEMAVETDTSRVPFQAVGAYWQATVTPTAGNIWVSVESKDNDSSSYNILKYNIVPALRQRKLQPGEHRKVVADSVAYLRR